MEERININRREMKILRLIYEYSQLSLEKIADELYLRKENLRLILGFMEKEELLIIKNNEYSLGPLGGRILGVNI